MMSLRTVALALAALVASQAHAGALQTAPVERTTGATAYVAEGVVEAVRETTLAVEVQGRIAGIRVQAGDHVKAGQVLARIDARLVGQQAAASRAQVDAAQARLAAAQKEYERSQQLAQKHYISTAALERAEAEFRAREAAAKANNAEAAAADVGGSLHTLVAPYAGQVSSVDVSLGDMALPGRPLITLFDPRQLRVTAHVPSRVQVLPLADAASHTAELRLEMDAVPAGVMPGMFARVRLASGSTCTRDGTMGRDTAGSAGISMRAESAFISAAMAGGTWAVTRNCRGSNSVMSGRPGSAMSPSDTSTLDTWPAYGATSVCSDPPTSAAAASAMSALAAASRARNSASARSSAAWLM